ARHLEVEDDTLGPERAGTLEGLQAVASREDPVAGAAQPVGHDLEEIGLVVDHQDPTLLGGHDAGGQGAGRRGHGRLPRMAASPGVTDSARATDAPRVTDSSRATDSSWATDAPRVAVAGAAAASAAGADPAVSGSVDAVTPHDPAPRPRAVASESPSTTPTRARSLPGSPQAAGSRTTNRDPIPSAASTQIRPPCSSTRCRAIVSPRPLPVGLSPSTRPTWQNLSKTRTL